jgi:hypothetical protein
MIYILLMVLLISGMMIWKERKKMEVEKLFFRCRSCGERFAVKDWLNQDYQCLNKECELGRRRRNRRNRQEEKEINWKDVVTTTKASKTEIVKEEERGLILFVSEPTKVATKEKEVPRSIVMKLHKKVVR